MRLNVNAKKEKAMLNKAKKTVMVFIVILMTSLSFFIYAEWPKVFKKASQIPLVGWFIAYNFRPSDFSVPLANVPLSEGKHSLRFKCKYNGRHEIQIRPITEDSPFENDIRMKVRITDSDGILLYEEEKNNARILGGALENGTNIYNYCYAILNVPTDIPLGAELYAHIECCGNITEILKHNPDAKIVIKKCFDK
jgi:hypothetical protein